MTSLSKVHLRENCNGYGNFKKKKKYTAVAVRLMNKNDTFSNEGLICLSVFWFLMFPCAMCKSTLVPFLHVSFHFHVPNVVSRQEVSELCPIASLIKKQNKVPSPASFIVKITLFSINILSIYIYNLCSYCEYTYQIM